ncbi:MAG TPA: PEGA domain-containing protein [Methanoregulaceae archaeon]|nr:PEGA domain-containing protein [Methanoregulaceae archaeon]
MQKITVYIILTLLISLGFIFPLSTAQVTGTGWVSISSNPSGARVLIDGNEIGYTPVSQYRLSATEHLYSVLKDGYTPAQKSFSVTAGQTTTLNIELVPLSGPTTRTTIPTIPTTITIPPTTPVPSAGSIYATTSPSGASIYLNGVFQGNSPINIPNLAPRTYSVLARLEGYSDYASSVTVYSGQQSNFYAQMQQSPIHRDYGYISISSSPSGAAIYVDGTYKGITPVTVTEFPGNHAVSLQLSGYNTYSQNVYVTAQTTQYISASLSPVSQGGSIRVSSSPGVANVYLDNTYRGQTDSSGNLVISNIPSGTYSVKVSKSRYTDQTFSVQVRNGQESYVEAHLSYIGPTVAPTTPPAQSGSLSVSSTPSGAQAFIDNVFRGYTPSTYDGLPVGMHSLTLKLSGYEDFVTTVQINPGSTATVQASLSPASTPTQSAPWPMLGICAMIAAGCILIRRKSQ